MEAYQPIYDAVRSRISNGDIGGAVESAAREAFSNVPFQFELVAQEFGIAAAELRRPSAVFKPTLSLDGNAYCFLLGEDLMAGGAGFGSTVAEAAADFDKNFHAMKAPTPAGSASGPLQDKEIT